MKHQEAAALFHQMHPDFFERHSFPEDETYSEMMLRLADFDPERYAKPLPHEISFGFFQGDPGPLLQAVGQVDAGWVQYFHDTRNVYCGYVNGRIASFCFVSHMGDFMVEGRVCKIGGPGCVGTVPEFRCRGIGLTMVENVTEILKNRGYDYSYIHYTGVAPWYEKLGYETILRWNAKGILD